MGLFDLYRITIFSILQVFKQIIIRPHKIKSVSHPLSPHLNIAKQLKGNLKNNLTIINWVFLRQILKFVVIIKPSITHFLSRS